MKHEASSITHAGIIKKGITISKPPPHEEGEGENKHEFPKFVKFCQTLEFHHQTKIFQLS